MPNPSPADLLRSIAPAANDTTPPTTPPTAPVANLGMPGGAQPPAPSPFAADSILSRGAVPDSLVAMLQRSTAGDNKNEYGSAIWRLKDGTHIAIPAPPPATRGTFFDQTTLNPLPPEAGATLVAVAHSHPFSGFVPGGWTDPNSGGGGSDADWDEATFSQMPQYTVSSKMISRLDPGVDKKDRSKNPNRWPTYGGSPDKN